LKPVHGSNPQPANTCIPPLLKLVEIGVGRRVTQRAAHGSDLAFVMKGMRQHMVKNERRGANGNVPIGEMKFRIVIELLIGQG